MIDVQYEQVYDAWVSDRLDQQERGICADCGWLACTCAWIAALIAAEKPCEECGGMTPRYPCVRCNYRGQPDSEFDTPSWDGLYCWNGSIQQGIEDYMEREAYTQ